MKALMKAVVVKVLTLEASFLLRRTKPKIVAITGNVGKTSTKDAIFAVLNGHVRTRKSQKSYNSELSVPLTVLGLGNAWNNPFLWIKNIIEGLVVAVFQKDYPEVLVLEMGVDRPGDMSALTSWIKPDVVVITRLPDVPVHVEYFSTPEEVVEEKLVLLHALKTDGVFVYNHDDEKALAAAESIHQQAIGYSRYSLSHFTASADKILYDGGVPRGLEFVLTHLDTAAKMEVRGSLGVQHAYNYSAAAAVGSIFGVSLADAMERLREHMPPRGRMRIIRGLKDTLIIDDTYNSSPTATERALQTLRELKGAKRKIAVLGDMLELGRFSVREHEKVGEMVPACADILITIGVRSRKIAEGALEHGMSEKKILQYDDVIRAKSEIRAFIEKGDVLLVKGSQSIRAELLVKEIMLNQEEADTLLVRQDPMWQEKKVQVINPVWGQNGAD